jgi:four helix bundle protein
MALLEPDASQAYKSQFGLEDFDLYRFGREFRKKVYRLIRQLPSDERYCLDKQMRRAAMSITNNIAEGHGRWHYRENIQFCRTSRGSVEEALGDINACEDERYGDPKLVAELQHDARVQIARINSYIAYLRRTQQGRNEE